MLRRLRPLHSAACAAALRAPHLFALREHLGIKAVAQPQPQHDHLRSGVGAACERFARPCLPHQPLAVTACRLTASTTPSSLRTPSCALSPAPCPAGPKPTWCAASMCRNSSVLAGTRLGTEMPRVTGWPLLQGGHRRRRGRGVCEQLVHTPGDTGVQARQLEAGKPARPRWQRHVEHSHLDLPAIPPYTPHPTCTWWQTGAARRRGGGRRRRRGPCRS